MKGEPLEKATVRELLDAEKAKASADRPTPAPTQAPDLDGEAPGALPSPA